MLLRLYCMHLCGVSTVLLLAPRITLRLESTKRRTACLHVCCLHVLLLHFLTTTKRLAESATDIRVEDEVPSQRCLQPLAGPSSTNWCLLGASWCGARYYLRWHLRAPTRLYRFPPVPGYRWNSTRGRVGLLHVGVPQSVYIVHFCTPMTRVSVLVCLPTLTRRFDHIAKT